MDVKEHPLKTIAALVAACSVIIGALFTVDARYAHAGDFQVLQQQLKQQWQDNKKEIIEDRVFELELRKASNAKAWTSIDEAMLVRYKRKLEDIGKK